MNVEDSTFFKDLDELISLGLIILKKGYEFGQPIFRYHYLSIFTAIF